MLCRRAIQRLYGDKSEDVFAAMRQHPASAVPIVLRRLQQKHTEWRAAQRQWNRVWREANERNYLKSLDYKVPAPRGHSSQVATFKRQDPLACKPKTLKQNMRERRDAYRAVGGYYIAADMQYRASSDPAREVVPPPIMEYVFQDVRWSLLRSRPARGVCGRQPLAAVFHVACQLWR